MSWRPLALVAAAFACAVLLAAPGPSAPPAVPKSPDRFSLPVRPHGQETENWCWAATSQMVMDFFNVRVTQGELANKEFQRTDCGRRPAPEPCNQGGGYDVIKSYGFTYDVLTQPISREEIVHQIYALRKPIPFGWDWSGGGGHVMVVVGYQRLKNGSLVVEYLDPWPPPLTNRLAPAGTTRSFCTYEQWCEADGHKLSNCFINIDPPVNPAVNLLVNGSFEEGPDPGARGYASQDAGTSRIKGWTVTRGQIDYYAGPWQAAQGERCLDLHGSPGYGGVKQTFKTKPGQRYRVTFSLAGNPDGRKGVKKLAVAAAGKTQEFGFDVTGKTAANMGWQTKTWEFDAVADETALEFYTVEKTDPNCGPALDNVRVVAAPKP